VASIEAMAVYVDRSVDTALAEIVKTAEAMGSPVVPVGFIEALIGQRSTGAKQIYLTIEELDAPVDFGTVPNDLSELEGL